jgi:LysR family hca operon transcriptional activator
MDRKIELRHLRYFIAIADTGSFTRAADFLHTSQPSLSRQFQDPEAAVGVALIERNSRRLGLTAAGQVFLDESRQVLAQLEHAVEKAGHTARGNMPRLALGFIFIFGIEMELLVSVTKALHDDLKSVDLSMRSQSSPELVAAVHRQELDAAFVRPDETTRGLALVPLRSERLIVVLFASHRLAQARRMRVEDLAEEPFVTVANKSAPVLDAVIRSYIEQHGISPDTVYEAQNLTMAFSLITSMGAVGLLPQYAEKLLPKSVVGIPLSDEGPTIDLVLAYRPDNPNAQLRSFLAYFLDAKAPVIAAPDISA